MAQDALHAKDALAFAFQYSEDGTIHVETTQCAFFNSITEWKHDTAEIAMCAYRMAVAFKDLCALHRSDHAALGAGALYIPPTDAEMLTWRSGRDATAVVAAVLPVEVLNEAYTDYLGGYNLLCSRYKITAVAAKAVQKRTATKHINTVLQKALLVAIEKEVKVKHLSDIPEVVENEQKYGVISVAESNFVMKLSLIALFLQLSTIIWSEVKTVAGAARKLFMTPDIFRSLASDITAIQPGFDLLRS